MFERIQSAAHDGDFGLNSRAHPTLEQIKAGNYKKGRVTLYGLPIAIETPQGQRRTGKSDGKPWSVICMAHYGYIAGTKAADGDPIDVYIGPWPEANMVYVINQNDAQGNFDEVKVMMAFPTEESAKTAYMNSYERGWTGFGSLVPCTIEQFKWWLKYGNTTIALTPAALPYDPHEETETMTAWDSAANPIGTDLAGILYELRREDADGELLDACTVEYIINQAGGGMALDALVVPFKMAEKKMAAMQRVMEAAGNTVSVTAMQVTPPFKQRGTTNVAAVFELSDGQTVSIFFHNPDTTPNKIAPDDELVSWKWMLNKKDITILVAPEKGEDLNVREVARRIMRIAEKNSAKFAAANKTRADRLAAIDSMKDQVAAKEGELAQLDAEIADLTAKVEAKRAEPDNAEYPEAPEGWVRNVVSNGAGVEYVGENGVTIHYTTKSASGDRGAYRIKGAPEGSKTNGFAPWTGYAGDRPGYVSWERIFNEANAVVDKKRAELAPAPAPAPAPAAAGGIDADVAGVKTRFTIFKDVDAPDDWLVMNAPRPLLGTKTVENGTFLTGRFYAAISPTDEMASRWIAENKKLDAVMVLVATADEQMVMALNKYPEYKGQYLEMLADDKDASAIKSLLPKIQDAPYFEAVAMLEDARAELDGRTIYQLASNVSATAPEQHYSDQILAALISDYGWKKSTILGGVEKEVGGGQSGEMNPEGKRIVGGRFNENGRYLSLTSGGVEIFDMDCRDLTVADAAKTFDARVMKWAASTSAAATPAPTAINPTSPDGYAAVMADKALQEKYQDDLDALFQERIVAVRNALVSLGWSSGPYTIQQKKVGGSMYGVTFKTTNIGTGNNVVAVSWSSTGGGDAIVDDLTKTPEELAKQIDAAVLPANSSLPTIVGNPGLNVGQMSDDALKARRDEIDAYLIDANEKKISVSNDVLDERDLIGEELRARSEAVNNAGRKAEDRWFETEERAAYYLRSMGYVRNGDVFSKAGFPNATIVAGSAGEGGFVVRNEEFTPDIDELISKVAAAANQTKERTAQLYREQVYKNGKAAADELLQRTLKNYSEPKYFVKDMGGGSYRVASSANGNPISPGYGSKAEAEAALAAYEQSGDFPEPAGATQAAANEAIRTISPFLSSAQRGAMKVGMLGEEGQYFRDKAVEMAGVIAAMPKTYEQDGKGDAAVAHLHYFKGGADWYITEKDMSGDGTEQAFGLADLGYGPELGYISIAEIVSAGAELDLHWTPKTIGAIKGGESAPAADLTLSDFEPAPEVVKGWTNEQYQDEYAQLEDENSHGEALLLKAKRFGIEAQMNRAVELINLHEKAGELTPEISAGRQALEAELNAAIPKSDFLFHNERLNVAADAAAAFVASLSDAEKETLAAALGYWEKKGVRGSVDDYLANEHPDDIKKSAMTIGMNPGWDWVDGEPEARPSAMSQADAIAQEKENADMFTAFDPASIKMPTAVQLGIQSNLRFRLLDTGGWSNGFVLDINNKPKVVADAYQKYYNSDPKGLSTVGQDAVSNLVNKAKGESSYAVSPKSTYQFGGQTYVVLANEEAGVAQAVNSRYFAYFFKNYKGISFYAPMSDVGAMIVVKKGSEVIGLISAMNTGGQWKMLKYGINAKPAPEKVPSEADYYVKQLMDAYKSGGVDAYAAKQDELGLSNLSPELKREIGDKFGPQMRRWDTMQKNKAAIAATDPAPAPATVEPAAVEPAPAVVPEPTPEPTPEPVQPTEDTALAEAKKYLQSVIDGAVPFDEALSAKLEDLYAKHEADADFMALFEQAANVYSDAMIKAAQAAMT